jgi:hypothetical protein
MLARTRTRYAIQGTASMPGLAHHVHQPMSQPLSTFWRRLRHMNLKNSIVSRLSPKMLNIPAAKYALVPCAEETSIAGNSLVGPQTRIVPLHTADYEAFLNSGLLTAMRTPQKINKAVFVDQNTPYHVDYNEINARKIVPDAYYRQLRAAFDAIEDTTGIQIEIAQHPRATYEKNDPRFGGRPIYIGRTMEMIAESDLVLTHHSTAIGLAILMKKPVAFLVSKELYQRHPADRACFDALCKEVGSPLRFMDQIGEDLIDGLFNVDPDLYDRYAARYLRHTDAQDAPYWDAAKTYITEISSHGSALKNDQSIQEERVAQNDR